MDACYYSLIRRTEDGRVVAWVPDLPGIAATGSRQDEVIRELSRSAREYLHEISDMGLPLPAARPPDELPYDDPVSRCRRLLLILG